MKQPALIIASVFLSASSVVAAEPPQVAQQDALFGSGSLAFDTISRGYHGTMAMVPNDGSPVMIDWKAVEAVAADPDAGPQIKATPS